MPPSRRVLAALVTASLFPAAMLGGATAGAQDLPMSAQTPHFACSIGHVALLHASFHAGYHRLRATPLQAPLPCCDGKLACAQFLSTRTVLQGHRRWHT